MPRYSVEVYAPCRDTGRDHYLAVVGDIDEHDLTVRRVTLVSPSGWGRDILYYRASAKVRIAIDDALFDAWRQDLEEREAEAADLSYKLRRDEC